MIYEKEGERRLKISSNTFGTFWKPILVTKWLPLSGSITTMVLDWNGKEK
jgi:hypothetical protein